MGLIGRFRRPPSSSASGAEEESEADQASLERRSPGIETLFGGLAEDGTHAILDLGPSSGGTFRVHQRFARVIRFADLLADPPHGSRLTQALQRLEPLAEGGFDLVLAWNLLDLLTPSERLEVIGRIDGLTGPGARLYALVDGSGETTTHPMRFGLVRTDRVTQEPVGPRQPLRSPLLPADVERVLTPFQVIHAFTLRSGLREYVGIKGHGKASSFGETSSLR